MALSFIAESVASAIIDACAAAGGMQETYILFTLYYHIICTAFWNLIIPWCGLVRWRRLRTQGGRRRLGWPRQGTRQRMRTRRDRQLGGEAGNLSGVGLGNIGSGNGVGRRRTAR